MPRLIQTVPVALLSTLTSKDGGIGPSALLDEVRGVVDLQNYYGANFRRTRILQKTAAQLAAAGVATGGWYQTATLFGASLANLTVIDGQLWRVRALMLQIIGVTGAVRGTAGWCWKDPAFGAGSFGTPLGLAAPATSATTKHTSGGQCDIWALPTSCFAFHLDQFALGVNDCDLDMEVEYELYTL